MIFYVRRNAPRPSFPEEIKSRDSSLHSISPIFVPAKLRAIRGTHFHPPLLALIATHSSLELLGPTTRRQGDWGEKLLFGGVEATPLSNPAQKAFVPRDGLGLLDSGCSHVLFCAHFCA